MSAAEMVDNVPAAGPVADPYDFSDIPLPEDSPKNRATLAQMLGEGTMIPARGMLFVARSPSIREMLRILPIVDGLQDNEGTKEQLEGAVDIALELLRVPEAGGRLRASTRDEILDSFTVQSLMKAINDHLRGEGASRQDASGNA